MWDSNPHPADGSPVFKTGGLPISLTFLSTIGARDRDRTCLPLRHQDYNPAPSPLWDHWRKVKEQNPHHRASESGSFLNLNPCICLLSGFGSGNPLPRTNDAQIGDNHSAIVRR